MRKSKILLVIKSELEKSNSLGKRLLEINLFPQYQNGKVRLAYCVLENNNTDQIKGIIDNALVNEFIVTFNLYESIDDAIECNSNEVESMALENNWRGRLFHQRNLDGKTNDEIKEFLVKSIWRVIIECRNSQYFTRHDIFPCFWYPGHSIGGKESFREDFESILEQLKNDKNERIDNKFDKIKVFASDRQNQYSAMRFSGVQGANAQTPDKYDCTLSELRDDVEVFKRNLIADLNNQFGTNF